MNKIKNNKISLLTFWFFGALIVIATNTNILGASNSSVNFKDLSFLILIPLIASFVLSFIYINLFTAYRLIYAYFLFFLISLTSLFGFTEALTGTHATSKNILFYGLAFYSTSLAYIIFNNRLKKDTFQTVSNPLLLFTGPLAVYLKNISYKSFKSRFKYFMPYIILGLFLFQTIGTPLSLVLGLIEYTDSISSIVFAIIFELFIYANFCGLSLIVYGMSGIIGYKIPLNFRQPFSSNNIIEFWRGWHLSLSLVLKNLFYSPIRKLFGTSAAVIAVFFASSLWHGVTINFLIWGLLHATFFIISLFLIKRNYKILPLVLLITGIVLGRMIFADSNTGRLMEKLAFNFGYSGLDHLINLPSTFFLSLGFILIFVFLEFFLKNNKYFISRNYKFYRMPLIQGIILLLTVLTISTSIGVEFAVYGQR